MPKKKKTQKTKQKTKLTFSETSASFMFGFLSALKMFPPVTNSTAGKGKLDGPHLLCSHSRLRTSLETKSSEPVKNCCELSP